ncbi:hypothetical protein C8J56DRAFT_848120 [Mycena floridula]|nr:hypothetical protein C8J56DRAFT_848120 [Mycena floridula]
MVEPEKPGRGRPRKQARVDSEKPADRNIQIYVQIFTPEQIKALKPGKQLKTPALNDFFSLSSSEEYDTFCAQLLVILDKQLNPVKIDISDYTLMYNVPRHSPQQIVLDSAKFGHLVEMALRSKTDPKANVFVEPSKTLLLKKIGNTETVDAEDEGPGDKRPKGTKSQLSNESQVPKPAAILPANKLLNETIGTLRERWKCPSEGRGPCGSEFCFISPDGNDHFPLTHARSENWGAAIIKGPNYVTIDRPPSNTTFDELYKSNKPGPSILQQRIAARNQPPSSSAPIINNHMNFPAELFAAFQGPARAAPVPESTSSIMLMPSTLALGPKMSIAEFCAAFCTENPNIVACLIEAHFTSTTALRRIELSQLRDIGLKPGDVAALQDAVEEWANKK